VAALAVTATLCSFAKKIMNGNICTVRHYGITKNFTGNICYSFINNNLIIPNFAENYVYAKTITRIYNYIIV